MTIKNDTCYLTQQELQFHAKNPSNFGIKSDLSFISARHNPSCGDSVTMAFNIVEGKVVNLCFEGVGCIISMATASKMTIVVEGMTLFQIKELDDLWLSKLLGIELGPNRIKCALLSLWALQSKI